MKRHNFPGLESLEGRALLSGLVASLTTNQTAYTPGQPIVMTFQETNVSNQAISVEDGPSIDGFDVTQGNKLIWRSNSGVTPMFIRLDTLQPGQSLTLSATWNGVPAGGSTPISGTFDITNTLNPQAVATVTVTSSTSPTTNPGNGTPSPQPVGVVTNPDPIPVGPVTPPSPSTGTPPNTTPISQDPGTTPSTTVSDPSPIAVSVSTSQPTYHMGHRVRMTMTLQNVSNSSVAVPKGSAREFTLFKGSTPVWHRAEVVSKGGSQTLKPGETVKLTAAWNGKVHLAGVPLVAGTYTLEASQGGYSGATTIQVGA